MSRFDMSIEAFTPPDLPPQPPGMSPSDIRSGLISSAYGAISSLFITVKLPFARDAKDPLWPATHLQLHYHYPESGDTFIPNLITSSRLLQRDSDAHTYDIEVAPEDIPRAKVNHGTTTTGELILYAWKTEKLLGKWTVGEIEGLGLAGLKSTELSLSRQQARERAKQKNQT